MCCFEVAYVPTCGPGLEILLKGVWLNSKSTLVCNPPFGGMRALQRWALVAPF